MEKTMREALKTVGCTSYNKNLLQAMRETLIEKGLTDNKEWNDRMLRESKRLSHILIYKPNILEFHSHSGVGENTIYELPGQWDEFIEAAEKQVASYIQVGDYIATFNEDKVHFGCQTFTKKEVELLRRIMDSPTEAKVKIQGTVVTKEILDRILGRLK